MMRFYPESDGGKTWVGHYWSRQPKTYYVVDTFTGTGCGTRDCNSWREAKELATQLNEEYERNRTQ